MSFLQRSNNVDIIDGLDLAVDRDYDKNAMLRIMELYKLRDIMMQYLEEQEVITPPPKIISVISKIPFTPACYTVLTHYSIIS